MKVKELIETLCTTDPEALLVEEYDGMYFLDNSGGCEGVLLSWPAQTASGVKYIQHFFSADKAEVEKVKVMHPDAEEKSAYCL